MPIEVGQVVSDYEILDLLGKGGMGRVYRVRHVISNRIEAMKVLLADLAAEEELGDRFIGEIRTLARLDHPNIAKFHTAFKVENQLVMIMEFVEGFALSERARQGAIRLDEVLSYTTQTLAALAYAHAAGVIHRDIKPANIMVTPHGVAKLMDFGIAKSNIDPLVTRPGTTMGSMLYMSPEQVRGTPADARSDIYSVGVLLYELSAGRRPFDAENTFAILEAQLNTPAKPPIELNPSLPQALNEIILTAMDKEPMKRFQSADAFRKALETVRSRPVMTQTQAAPQSAQAFAGQPAAVIAAPETKKGSRGLWMAAGAVACVLVLGGAAVTLPHFLKSSAATKTEMAANKPAALETPAPAQTAAVPTPAPDTSAAIPTTPTTVTPPTTQPTPTPVPEPARKDKRVSRKQAAQVAALETKPLPPQPGQAAEQQTSSPATAAIPSGAPAPSAAAGPSQEQMDQADEDLMKLRSRADAVRGSLDHLRAEQASSGLSIRQDIASAASRMDSYLQAAQRAVQSNNLDSARKNIDRAEGEIGKLEAFFGK